MQILTLGPLKLIGLTVTAGWDALWTEMPQAWRSLFARGHEIPNRVALPYMDVSLEQRDGVYTQLLAAEVSALAPVPDGMVALEIPEQTYLAYRHAGALPEIASAFGAMYDWAEQNGVALDAFKLDIGYLPDGTEPCHDLFIRVASPSSGSPSSISQG